MKKILNIFIILLGIFAICISIFTIIYIQESREIMETSSEIQKKLEYGVNEVFQEQIADEEQTTFTNNLYDERDLSIKDMWEHPELIKIKREERGKIKDR